MGLGAWGHTAHRAVRDTVRVRVWVRARVWVWVVGLGLGLGSGVTDRAVAAVDREVRVGPAEDA